MRGSKGRESSRRLQPHAALSCLHMPVGPFLFLPILTHELHPFHVLHSFVFDDNGFGMEDDDFADLEG